MSKKARNPTIALGFRGQLVSAGDHLAYFWETEEQFAEAVEFLEAGLRGADHCVVLGHTEANAKVLAILARSVDPESPVAAGRISVVDGEPSGERILGKIVRVFDDAMASGAPLIRLLGNIGWGRPGWPDDDDALAFEARLTATAGQFPCVVVCLYDVRALGGHILLHGGFEAHPLTVCGNVLRENPYYWR